ncbi:MAG: phosphoesterase, PA-phosphatase related [Tardiphaga sp.]|uniref:phosphatase PAP2 family protein n=1 Tax=Tardiphaga sp. TaxID=1926292 RepID=UPI002638FD7D|nr:phosphatase PAP2 family protein [Tardiphaga sp.]MDB5503163.1 phosphoesterase, PA-phosphatase related [Tardiphaga sp.]
MSALPTTGPASGYLPRLSAIVWQSLAQLVRTPSHSRRAEAARHWARRSLALAGITALVIVALMYVLDAFEIGLMPARGTAWLWPVRIVTDFGKSSYVLWALFGILVVVALLAPRLRGLSGAVMISLGTRIQYIFLSVAFSVLVGELIKGIVGRGRPFVGGVANPFNFSHFAWSEAYASFPSGHATTSFALAFAVSAVWPRLRSVMFAYAIIIIASRLVLLAHHPSDVVAGALTGVIGAMAVRYWFAARHLAFTIRSDGTIDPLAGPSPRHLKRVAREAFAP